MPVTTTFTGRQLQSLPVRGRRWQQLFLDTAAAAPGAGNALMSLRGAGQNAADMTVDGASTRLAFGASADSSQAPSAQNPSAPTPDAVRAGAGWTGGRGFTVSSEAIREVRVVAGNVEAAGASAAGGRAGIETKSGGNQLHGQAYFSDRQNSWGARNPFTEWLQNTGTVAAPSFQNVPFTPPDHETSWGFGAGGRILRNRLFWFAALDGYHRNDPGLAEARYPIGVNQYGDCYGLFCPPSVPEVQLLSAQLEESQSQAYNDYMGIPRAGIAGAGLEQLASLLGPGPRTAAQWNGFARLDWKASERNQFTLEGTGADFNSPGGGMNRVSENYGNHSFGSRQSRQQWLLARWETYLTPNLLFVTQGSAGRDARGARPDAPSAFEQTFLGSAWNGYGQLPQIVVDTSKGFTIGNPARFGEGDYPDEHRLEGQEMVDWVHGKLLVRSGFQVDHDTDRTTLLRDASGTYTYSKVQNFISDALVFEKYGIAPNGWQTLPGGGQTFAQHSCSPLSPTLVGPIPCYSYFSQVIGPNLWQIGTNDWASYATAQWQANPFVVVSAGLRWERQQLPAPMAALANPALTEQLPNQPPPLLAPKLPSLGNQWGPRVGLAIGHLGRWPVLRFGYGMYFGQTENATLETALTQTGSLKGDLYFFIRPTDGYTSATNSSSAPLFPNALSGPPASVVSPGAVGFAPNFRNPEVQQALAGMEQRLPGRMTLRVSALLSLGRRLPVSIDTNIDPSLNPQTITYAVKDVTGKGPIKTPTVTVPFFASWPAGQAACASENAASQCGRINAQYQQVTEIESRANSTYEAGVVRFTRASDHGLSLRAHYTYSHAMDWNPDATTLRAGSTVLDPRPQYFRQEYGTSNLDIRHSAAAMLIYEAPWKLRGAAGRFTNGWVLSSIGNFRSGLPYSMRVTGSLPRCVAGGTGATSCTIPPGVNAAAGAMFTGLGPSMNGYGGDNRLYGLARNTFRYPSAWKLDLRVAKKFDLGESRELELMAETFNLFNHENVTEIDTTGYAIEAGTATSPPQLCYLAINATGGDSCETESATNPGPFAPAFGQPLNINATNFYRERQIQLGAHLRF